MSSTPSPVLAVFIPNSFLELSLLHHDSGDSSSSFFQHAANLNNNAITVDQDHRDHQLHPAAHGSEFADGTGQNSSSRSDHDSDSLDSSSPEQTSFLLLDFSPMSSTSSLRSSRSIRTRPRSPPGLYGYDDAFKPREERTERKLRQQKSTSTSSGDSRPSSESRRSTKSSKQLRRSGSISISSSLRPARVPDVPSHPPSPSPSDIMSPSFDEDPTAETARRLRQLHKVSRTLGENIPAELVLGPGYRPPAPPKEQPKRTNNSRRRASLSLAAISPFKPSAPPAVNSRQTPANPSIPLPAYTYPKPPKIEQPVQQIDITVPESVTPPSTGSLPDPEPSENTLTTAPQISRSRSLRSLRRKSSDDDLDRNYTRPQTPFMDTAAAAPVDTKTTVWSSDGEGFIVRRERRQGWSGEWNQHNMQDVISKLRNLK